MPRGRKTAPQAAEVKTKDSAAKLMKTVLQQTRRRYSAEEKIRVALEGLRELSIHRDLSMLKVRLCSRDSHRVLRLSPSENELQYKQVAPAT